MYIKDLLNLLKPKYVRKKQVIKLNEKLNEILTKEEVKRIDLIKDTIKIIGQETNNLQITKDNIKEFNSRYFSLVTYLNNTQDYYHFLGLLLYLIDCYLYGGVSDA